MSIEVRLMDESDFDEADRIAQVAFERPLSFRPMLRLHKTIEPEGLWVATDCGRIVGTVSCVDYDGLAYVGLMTVDPEFQRRGIARRLMSELLAWLDRRGTAVALLDATDKGAPLYEQLGFRDDVHAHSYERVEIRPGVMSDDVRGANERDLGEIIAFDAPAFGADRGKLLGALWPEFRQRCLVARDAGGGMIGYLFARDPILGPWVATDAAVAEKLLAAALVFPFQQAPAVLVPRSNSLSGEVLRRYGFVQRRRLRHMRKGGDGSPGHAALLFGQSSFGHG